jgi:exonuclease SbcD
VRILHTSDWHIGSQCGSFSRSEEHDAFFRWLSRILSEERVDALIVAGDVFDGMQPSNESLRLYYRFLRDLEGTGVCDVVVVGGNHDSASQLDAPREVLSALSIHVIGGYSSDVELDRYVVPLHARDRKEPAAVCIALPYVHEYRLGIRTTEGDVAATRHALVARFKAVYQELTSHAATRYPGLPLLATGHLTMGKVEDGDTRQAIHQVGFIDSLPPELFDSRLAYVALGHIHRSFPVENRRIWYSGSPIPVSKTEMDRPRRVLLVDINSSAEPVEVRPVEVPIARALLEYEGTETEVINWVHTLRWQNDYPPFLHLRVRVDEPQPLLVSRVRAELERFPKDRRPQLVEFREVFASAGVDGSEPFSVALEELTVREVFARLCRQRNVAPSEELLKAFEFAVTAKSEEIEREVDAVMAGSTSVSKEGVTSTNIPSKEVSSS